MPTNTPRYGAENEKRIGPGAGRPRSEITKARDDLDVYFAQKVMPEVDSIIDRMVSMSLGERELVIDPDTGIPQFDADGRPKYVYTRLPDYKFASYVVDRIAGKPHQSIKIGGVSINIRDAATITETVGDNYVDPDERQGDN